MNEQPGVFLCRGGTIVAAEGPLAGVLIREELTPKASRRIPCFFFGFFPLLYELLIADFALLENISASPCVFQVTGKCLTCEARFVCRANTPLRNPTGARGGET